MPNSTRNIRVEICFTPDEHAALLKKIETAGIKNQAAYIRKMALHGYIVRFDTAKVQELLRLISNASSNINQISRRAGESRNVHECDVLQLAEQVEQLKESARKAANIYKQARQFLNS